MKRRERVGWNLSWHINKWFVSEYKCCLNSTVNQSHKQNNPIRKWANDITRHFTEEDINITNKHIKRCSLALRVMQVKTTMAFIIRMSE